MNKIYFNTILAAIFLLSTALPGAFAQNTAAQCTPTESLSIYPSVAFFNYGAGTNVRNTSRTMDLSIGQPVVDVAWDLSTNLTCEFGYWGQFLVPPKSPMVTATQGELLDRIQLKWALEPLGALPSEGFNIYRDSIFLVAVANNVRSYNDFNVIAGKPYQYDVRGINIYGEGVGGSAIGFQVPNGTVTGWVQTPSGNPVPDALVALTPMQGFSAKFPPGGGAFAKSNPGAADNLIPPNNGEWTLAFWMKTESAEQHAGVVSLTPFDLVLRAIPSASGQEGIEVAQTATGPALLTGIFPDSTKKDWHHVAFTMDSDGIGRLYIDGVLADLGMPSPVPSASELRIGGRTGSAAVWAGYLDELRVYHHRLDEIDLGEVKMGTASSLTPGLKYYWKMDEQLGVGSFDVLKRNRLYFCDAGFSDDKPPVRTMGKTNEEGYYRIESANYGTGITFLAEPMKDFYMYRALRFMRDSLSYATLPNFSVTPKATLEIWVNSAGPDNEQCLLSKQWPGNDFRLLLSPNGGNSSDVKFYINGQEGNFGPLGMGYQHLAFTMERNGSDLQVTAYQDSVLMGSHSFSGVSGDWSDPATRWMLGARPSGGGQTDYFGGLIDELALYDTTLSVAAIAGHFKNGREMQEPGLRVFFALDEGNGNRLNNSGSVLMPIGTTFKTSWTPFAARQKTEPHKFTPKTRQVTMNPSVTSVDQVDFVDRSTVAVSGYVRFANTDCFAKGVEIQVNGASFSPKILTDSTGMFVIDFDPGVTFTLTPVFEDHDFEPGERSINNLVTPITNLLFNDITTRQLSGRVVGGSKPTCLNSITNPNGENDCIISIRTLNGCYEDTLEVDIKDGFYEFLNLPPVKFTVSISNHNNPNIYNFFQAAGGRTIDLAKKDSSDVNFIYTALPNVEIAGLDDYQTGCSYEISSNETINNLIVFPQYESASLNIKVYEQYGPQNTMDMADRCYLDTAALTIINTFDQAYDPIKPIQDSLKGTNGATYQYNFTVDYPTPTPPHLKEMQITADVDGKKGTRLVKALITGISIGPTLFTTKSPMVPNFVLRDPPGDGSSAFLEAGTTICNSLSIENGGGGGAYFASAISGGASANIRIPFIGTLVKASFLNGNKTELSTMVVYNNTQSMEYCITTNERISTDDNDIIVGGMTSFDGGETVYNGNDIYIGTAFNFTFSKSLEIKYDNCLASTKEMATVSADSFATTYMYSGWNIQNNVIRYLKDLVDLGEDPDGTNSNAIKRWESFMALNQFAKEKAEFDRNISFDAGVQYENSNTITETEQVENSIQETIEGLFANIIDVEVEPGVGALNEEAEIGVKFQGNFLQKIGESWSNSVTTGYTLKDDDPGDNWTVDIKHDPIFKTPVFDIIAAQTSCPWEVGTANREKPVLGLSPLQILEVPSNEAAVFHLQLKNESGSEETWTYSLVTFPESNPDGAEIKVNGEVLNTSSELRYIVPYLGTVDVTLTVERGPEAYNYEGLQIGLVSGCEYDRNQALSFGTDISGDKFYSIRTLNVSFIEPCSEVDLFNPKDGWLLKQGSANLVITVVGYDKEDDDLEGVRLQYRPADGNGAWLNMINGAPDYIPKADLGNVFTQYNWDTGELGDGPYNVRASTACNGGPSDNPGYSHVISGFIDRLPPQLIGTPQPSDGVYHVGDEISFTFNQEINCSKLNLNPGATLLDKILLFDATTNQPIGITFGCYENKIVLTPTAAFQNEFFENKLIRAELHDIKDLSENSFEGTRANKGIWEFYVDRNELAWLTDSLGMTKFEDQTKTAVANIHNRGGYPVPFTINGVPDWVHVVPNQGTMAPNEIRPISFRVDSTLGFGLWSDSITLRTETGQNPFFMGGEEGLPFGVRVVCRPPNWDINPNLWENSENMVLELNIQGEVSKDVEDKVVAYIGDTLVGRANVQYVPAVNKYLAYLTIYGNPHHVLQPLRLEIWDASACLRYAVEENDFLFQPDDVLGDPLAPLVIHTNSYVLRDVPFGFGWNWLSFNLAFPNPDLDSALVSLQHPLNDLMKGQNAFSTYLNGAGWLGSLNALGNTSMYIYRADQADTLKMLGTVLKPDMSPIPVSAGWNWIGYVPNYSLPVNAALATLTAQTGDLVKSQISFAQYINPTFGWIGNLKFMQPPNGYQVKLSAPGTLIYPPPASNFGGGGAEKTAQSRGPNEEGPPGVNFWMVDPTQFENSMTLIGMLKSNNTNVTTSTMELGAFVGSQVRGTSKAIFIPPLESYLFFLTVYANSSGEQVKYQLFDSSTGNIADLNEAMFFSPDLHQGSIENPVPFTLPTSSTAHVPNKSQSFEVQPNPFHNETVLRFALAKAQDVRVTVTDMSGKQVSNLTVAASEGLNTVIWRGQSDNGTRLANGLYYVMLQTEAGNVVRKVVLH